MKREKCMGGNGFEEMRLRIMVDRMGFGGGGTMAKRANQCTLAQL